MATPATYIRADKAAGCKKGSTWGTAVALGAGDEMMIKGFNGFVHKRPYIPDKSMDAAMVTTGLLGDVEAVDGGLPFDWRYDIGALGRLIAAIYGTAGTPTTLATGAYKHVFQWADTTFGKFFTVAAEAPGKILEIPSFKPTGFTLKTGQVMEGEIKGIGNTLVDDSSTNTATQMDALTPASRATWILHRQGSFKMNTQSGADVSGTTALALINGIELSVARTGHDKVHCVGSDKIVESCETGHDIKLSIKFARYTDGYQAIMIAETLQKALLKFTGAVITGAYSYDLAFYFPQLRIVNASLDPAEIMRNGLELVGEAASAAPTGMTYARPYVELVNTASADYLA